GGKPFVVEEFLGKGSGAAADVLFAKGRIGEDEIEFVASGGELANGGEGVLDADLVILCWKACRRQIVADHEGVAIGFFDAQDESGAAAQTFKANGAGAGE